MVNVDVFEPRRLLHKRMYVASQTWKAFHGVLFKAIIGSSQLSVNFGQARRGYTALVLTRGSGED